MASCQSGCASEYVSNGEESALKGSAEGTGGGGGVDDRVRDLGVSGQCGVSD